MKNTASNIIVSLLVLFTVALGILIFIYPPSFFPDPSHGFQVMRSMQMGAPFNTFISPDQDDISKNIPVYLTWWSPGQYLVPYLFQTMFGLNTGHATSLTIILSELSGLFGFYCFFKKIGFTPLVSALSLVFIICQQAFIIPFVFYNGGEVLLFGFAGWFLYGCAAVEKADIKMVILILLSGWLGFFFKSSFIWIYASGLMCLWLRLSPITGKLNFKALAINALWIGIPAMLSAIAIYILFLSKGTNPAAASAGLSLSWQNFSFPLGSPLLAGFSVDDLAHGLLFHPVGSLLSPGYALIVLALSAIISLGLVAAIMRAVPRYNYRLFLMVFYTISILFFSMAFMRGASISYEGRHFRIIGLLITPGLIYMVSQFRMVFRIFFALICLAIGITNYAFLVKGYQFNRNISARGNSGLAQQYIDQCSLNYIMQLDRQNRNAIFAFITPDLGLEIKHNRVITMDVPPSASNVNYDDYSYDGHAGPLYILLPAGYNPAISDMFMKFFPEYSNFNIVKLSPNYILCSAK